jgi:hypothetical protein
VGCGGEGKRRDGVTDFRARGEERGQPVEHQPFDVARRNAPALGMLRTGASDQRHRDIVPIPVALLDGMGWRHPVTVAIEDQGRQQARRLGAKAKERSPRLAASLSCTLCQRSGSMIGSCWPEKIWSLCATSPR